MNECDWDWLDRLIDVEDSGLRGADDDNYEDEQRCLSANHPYATVACGS